MLFTDRTRAGVLLAEKLSSYRGTGAVVFGLARGGVVVARAGAQILDLPLDVLVVKKISAPRDPELAIGALAPDRVSYINWRLALRLGADEDFIKSQIRQLGDQIRQKTIRYRKGRKPYMLEDKTIVLVDDGVATGATLEAAIGWFRKKRAKRIVVAVPVAPPDIFPKITPEVDELVVLETPSDFSAVGQFYDKFPQVEDNEVVQLLR
ncbi:hypothetical protein A2973_02015 [Candidatus Gottesmanbacteria bacterium RIFCSPLOWO2_01_FULL_49_10]|uniref:Phosphoribosyltransferase domain-containing protein n=1 Tax=Candidatus Gottesmanbacteria bacterium RIFCSPLOWO2_01_FULL_49_10 TaxID=1798396 RepID=A0A1F6AWU7_9BACT|nr:MAG: hypothetical protein A2973_02015 [Candidatus Gottesmanbacteria bacterium RIFCSPLOWO2_01_FULL_49_10]